MLIKFKTPVECANERGWIKKKSHLRNTFAHKMYVDDHESIFLQLRVN